MFLGGLSRAKPGSFFRLILAQRLFGHVVARCLIRPGTAAAADAPILTIAAFIVQLAIVAQFLEVLGVSPYLAKRLPGNITAAQIKKTARLHDAAVGYETKTNAPQTAARYRI